MPHPGADEGQMRGWVPFNYKPSPLWAKRNLKEPFTRTIKTSLLKVAFAVQKMNINHQQARPVKITREGPNIPKLCTSVTVSNLTNSSRSAVWLLYHHLIRRPEKRSLCVFSTFDGATCEPLPRRKWRSEFPTRERTVQFCVRNLCMSQNEYHELLQQMEPATEAAAECTSHVEVKVTTGGSFDRYRGWKGDAYHAQRSLASRSNNQTTQHADCTISRG